MCVFNRERFRYSFEIAGITIALNTEIEISISNRFQPFLKEDIIICEYEAFFHQVEIIPEMPDIWLHNEIAFDVGRNSEGFYCRRFRDTKNENQVYAFAVYDWEKKRIEVSYLREGEANLNQTDNCFFHVAWETILQLKSRMILHACAIQTAYGGILFSGRSGIGKSTQGQLWGQYEGAFLINGDRPVIYKEGNTWYAYGSPYAGSSGCHINKKTAIRVIVMLQQADVCRIRRLNQAEAFRKIYAGLTMSTWNSECIRISCEQAEELTAQIPVYEMECTPDERAVILLKKTIQTEERI